MENNLSEIQEKLMGIRHMMDENTEAGFPLDIYTLGQIKVQLLDLLTVTELLIVTNQNTIPPLYDGQSLDGIH